MQLKKPDIYGIVGSATFCGLLLLLLLLIYLPTRAEEEGVMVSFGEVDNGGGNTPTRNVAAPAETAPPPQTRQRAVTEDVATQNYEESLRVEEQKRKEKERREAEEVKKRQEEQRLAEEKKHREEQEKINKANELSGLFGNSGEQGSGDTSGAGKQGNPLGQGNSGGNSWSLNGRSLNGSLITPNDNQNVEGKITVNIRVDKSGMVTQATVGSPSTISNQITREAAIEAARKTRFTAGNAEVVGTITYNIKLR
jgi:TonB family protein